MACWVREGCNKLGFADFKIFIYEHRISKIAIWIGPFVLKAGKTQQNLLELFVLGLTFHEKAIKLSFAKSLASVIGMIRAVLVNLACGVWEYWFKTFCNHEFKPWSIITSGLKKTGKWPGKSIYEYDQWNTQTLWLDSTKAFNLWFENLRNEP